MQGGPISVPIRVFTLKGLGINQESFVKFMLPWFSVLHLDPYDAKRNKVQFLKNLFPEEHERLDQFLADYYEDLKDLSEVIDLISRLTNEERHNLDKIGITGRRKRAIARFILRSTGNDWQIERRSAEAFRQKVGREDPRSLIRRFKEAPYRVVDNFLFRQLMCRIADITKEIRPGATTLEMTAHWTFVHADAMLEGDNSPEGIHQDGADYIVSALVLERAGILGGESVVYTGDKSRELLRHTLQVGEGLFQDDRRLWHYVTAIKDDPSSPPEYGNRSIIGFDINVTE